MAPLVISHYPIVVERHRKTLRHFEIVGQARYLTFSCYHRLPLFSNDAIKDAFTRQIAHVRGRDAFLLFAWVIMPEHVHLILVPQLPEWTVPNVLRALKKSFAQRVIARWRKLDAPILERITDSSGTTRFWQRGGGYDRNLEIDGELFEKIDYVHANPVRRQLVEVPTDWRWSSARWYAGMREELVKIDPME